jgi:hypothetical protein
LEKLPNFVLGRILINHETIHSTKPLKEIMMNQMKAKIPLLPLFVVILLALSISACAGEQLALAAEE